MKKILSLLMCYVFLQAQTFALRGWSGSGGTTILSGTYSAIMVQTSPGFDFATGRQTSPVGTGIGLVQMTVPQNGPATGDMIIFDPETGNAFSGTINGLSNVTTGQLVGIVAGDQIGGTNAGVATISGTLSVKIKQSGAKSGFQEIDGTATTKVDGIPVVFAVGNTPVNGITSGTQTTYSVTGYQSSTQATGTTSGFDITFGTGTTTTNGQTGGG
jgi:hypothetical protein